MKDILKSILFIIGAIVVIYIVNIAISKSAVDKKNILLKIKNAEDRIARLTKEIDEKDKLISQLQEKIIISEKKKITKIKKIENTSGKGLANEFTREGF